MKKLYLFKVGVWPTLMQKIDKETLLVLEIYKSQSLSHLCNLILDNIKFNSTPGSSQINDNSNIKTRCKFFKNS